MSLRHIIVGGAIALGALSALPLAAQQRGTVEFGAFGSKGTFDKSLTLDRGYGGGGHVGIYLDRRWALEFEKGEMKSTRTLGLSKVNVGILSARLVATPIKSGAFSMHIGAGAGGSIETNFLHSYAVNGLVGAKVALNNSVAIRGDYISGWLANYDWKRYQRVQLGLAFYRSPFRTTRDVLVPGAPVIQWSDSISADEARRLRNREAELQRLRDSLRMNPPQVIVTPPTVREVEILETHIEFAFDKSEITDSASRILDAKVQVFRDNPQLRIYITGHTGAMGSDAYNMALGERRAQAAKDYIVAKGIAADRIILDSKGERDPLVPNATAAAGGLQQNAPNRRDMFRLVIDPNLPKKP